MMYRSFQVMLLLISKAWEVSRYTERDIYVSSMIMPPFEIAIGPSYSWVGLLLGLWIRIRRAARPLHQWKEVQRGN
ncbi:hypothetical protein B0H11DRAFT_1953926 [Mycena galericulata]|nr:hypothetical protein B0H11DRAFT_1953926 [Mycena galericulata]